MAVAEEKCYGNLSLDTHNVISSTLSLVCPNKRAGVEGWGDTKLKLIVTTLYKTPCVVVGE